MERTCGHCEMYLHCLHYGKEIEEDTPECEDWEIDVVDLLEMIEKGEMAKEEIESYLK